MTSFSKVMIVFVALLALQPAVVAQSVSPDGETYAPAGRVQGYGWLSNTQANVRVDQIIIRDGLEFWNADNPDVCRTACEAFLGCQAFEFVEPKLLDMGPKCRLLRAAPELINSHGRHTYIRQVRPPPLPRRK